MSQISKSNFQDVVDNKSTMSQITSIKMTPKAPTSEILEVLAQIDYLWRMIKHAEKHGKTKNCEMYGKIVLSLKELLEYKQEDAMNEEECMKKQKEHLSAIKETAPTSDYQNMSNKDLTKLCKEKGIKTARSKNEKIYNLENEVSTKRRVPCPKDAGYSYSTENGFTKVKEEEFVEKKVVEEDEEEEEEEEVAKEEVVEEDEEEFVEAKEEVVEEEEEEEEEEEKVVKEDEEDEEEEEEEKEREREMIREVIMRNNKGKTPLPEYMRVKYESEEEEEVKLLFVKPKVKKEEVKPVGATKTEADNEFQSSPEPDKVPSLENDLIPKNESIEEEKLRLTEEMEWLRDEMEKREKRLNFLNGGC